MSLEEHKTPEKRTERRSFIDEVREILGGDNNIMAEI